MATEGNVMLQAAGHAGRRAGAFIYRNFVRGKSIQDVMKLANLIFGGKAVRRELERRPLPHRLRIEVREGVKLGEALGAVAIKIGEIVWEIIADGGVVEVLRDDILGFNLYGAAAAVVVVTTMGGYMLIRRARKEDVQRLRVHGVEILDDEAHEVIFVFPPRPLRSDVQEAAGLVARMVTRADLHVLSGHLAPVCAPMLPPPRM